MERRIAAVRIGEGEAVAHEAVDGRDGRPMARQLAHGRQVGPRLLPRDAHQADALGAQVAVGADEHLAAVAEVARPR